MVLFSAILFAASPELSAAPLALANTRAVRTIEGTSASLIERSLAYSCLSLPELPDETSCNPALNGNVTKPTLQFRGLLASGYANLTDMLSLSKGQFTQDTITKLFADDHFLLESEADLDLSFRSRWISAGYRPIQATGIIVARNEANPDIEVRAIKTQSFYTQASFEPITRLSLGARISYFRLNGVSGRFRLTDGVFPKSQTESRILVEPGAAYLVPELWNLRFSAFLARLGGRWGQKFAALDMPMSPEFGVSVTPPTYWGTLNLSLEFRDIEGGSTFGQKWRSGVLYRLGATAMSFGLDKEGVSFGVYALLESIGAGILVSTNHLPWHDNSSYTQTVYSQVVWSF